MKQFVLPSSGQIAKSRLMVTTPPVFEDPVTQLQPIFCSEKHKVIGGVCAGLALARGYPVVLVRMVALALFWFSGTGVLVYLACWALIPRASKIGVSEPLDLPNDPVQRKRSDKILGGVCSGLAAYFQIDAALARVICVLSFLFLGLGLAPYVYAWFVLPLDDAKRTTT